MHDFQLWFFFWSVQEFPNLVSCIFSKLATAVLVEHLFFGTSTHCNIKDLKATTTHLFDCSPRGGGVTLLDFRGCEGGHVFISSTAFEGQTPVG